MSVHSYYKYRNEDENDDDDKEEEEERRASFRPLAGEGREGERKIEFFSRLPTRRDAANSMRFPAD